jgi:type II secretion system protein D
MPVSIFAQEQPTQAPAPATSEPSPAPVTPEVAPPVATAPVPEAAPAPVSQPVATAQPEPQAAPPAAAQPSDQPITFNFKDTPIDRVLDIFARESGVPIIFEAPSPQGTITFISASGHNFKDALSILNLNLQRFGVHLRKQDQYLYLATLQDAMKKPLPVSSPEGVRDLTPDQIVTVNIPLDNARADLVAEQIKTLVGPYGGVVPVQAQNMIVVVETAAQIQRIREIIGAIDAVRPVDSKFEIFTLKHANCETVHIALKGLIGERTVTTFIDKDGRKTTTQDVSVAGLNLQPDPRTNSIIAVGSAARITTCRELIGLLDVPEGGVGGESQMLTITLAAISTEEAEKQLTNLFASVDAKRRPTIIPMPDASKVTLVGDSVLLAQAVSLLSQVDPGAIREGQQQAGVERRAKTISLKHTTPQAIESVLPRLLTPRQLQLVKFAPFGNGAGLVVTGPAADVDAFVQLVTGLDVATDADREVRLVRIKAENPKGVLDAAVDLYAKTGKAERDPVSASFDTESRTATLIGSRAALAAFDGLLATAQEASVVEQETRRFTLKKADASVLGPKVARLSRPLLTPTDGTAYAEPSFEGIDEVRTLLVRARPDQFPTIAGLIEQLDAEDAGSRELKVMKLSSTEPAAVLERAKALYEERTRGMTADQLGDVTARFDEKTGSVTLIAKPATMQLYSEALTQAQQLTPPSRTTRVVDLANASAASVLPELTAMLKAADSIDPGRAVPEPTFQAVEKTNSILVTAEEAQHALVRDFITRLDRLDRTDLPPLKLLQLRAADASGIASMLSEHYGKRSQTDRAAKPVDVRADAATNTLIVSAHPDLFEEIKSFVEELNKDKKTGPQRITQLFPLKVAKATEVANAMDKLYPEPPTPTDRLGRPQPWLKQPKEVSVSADAGSNSLIFDAPAERMESLQELAAKLDRVELPPAAQLKTYRIQGPSLDAVSRTLTSMSTRGVLNEPAQPGKQPVQVIIETEPKSSTLIVAGDAKTFSVVEQVLKELSLVPIEKGLRIFPIISENAMKVKDRALAIYDAQVAQIPGANPIDVQVDEATNSLSVVADAEAMVRFSKVMEELGRQAGPAREVHLVELKLAKVGDVIDFLRDMVKSSGSLKIRGGPEPEFEAIESTNSILVAAQPGQFAVIDALVRQLDNSQKADRPPMRILKLRSTDAENLAAVLQNAFDRRPVEQKSRVPVSIEADAATNTLIVSAHADALPEIEAIVTQLNDTQAVDADGREIRIFPLKVARAEELAQTIDQMYPEPPMPLDPRTRQPRPDLRQPREIIVRADRATNALIVDAPAKRLAGFEQIVKSLDQQKLAENIELRTYKVERAGLESVATTLKELAASGALAKGANAIQNISITTEAATRSLVVSGPAEIFTQVEGVLKQLDAAQQRPTTVLRMYALKHARAEKLQPLMEKMLQTRITEQQATGVIGADVKQLLDVAADSGSNTLIITAPEDVQKIADEVIKALDNESAAIGRNILRVLPLNFAEAGTVALALGTAITQMDLPSGGKVNVVAAPGSNALILTGVEKDLAKVEELIKPLDVKPSGAETPAVETFALKHADVNTIAKTVENLLVQQQQTDPRMIQVQLQLARQGRMDLFKQPSIRVEASARTNSLIISAPNATIELAKSIIDRLDQPADKPDRLVSTFTPLKGDPAKLAATVTTIVNETLAQGRGPVELTPETATGSIVVIGTQEQVAESLKLLAQFDERSISLPATDLQVVSLAHADATSAATTMQALLSDRSRWPAELRAAEKSGIAIPQPNVTADAKLNRLLISIPSVLSSVAMQLVETLDRPGENSAVDVQVFKMTSGDATSASEAIKAALTAAARPGDPAPSVTAAKASNTVVVAGSADAVKRAATMIQSMDQAVAPDGIGVRTIRLKHGRAETIAPVVEEVLQRDSMIERLPIWARVDAMSRGERELPVKVAAESRLNAIVVSGPTAVLEVAEQLVTELDVDSGTSDTAARSVRVVTLQNADAAQLATNLEAVFKDDTTDAPPIIRIDAQSNSLIVRASQRQMGIIDELTQKLDGATLASSRQMRMVPLDRSRADATIMADTLRRLLEQQGGVKVEVISSDELLKKAKGEKDDDDKPPPTGGGGGGGAGSGRAPHATPVSSIDAAGGSSLAQRMAANVILFVMAQPEGQGAPRPQMPASSNDGAGVTIAVDRASNSLLIVGSPRMTDRLVELATQLQDQLPAEPVGVKVVTLPATLDAAAVTELVRQTIAQIGRSSTQNPGGFAGPVSVMPDPSGGALVVLANDTDFDTVGKLIASVAQVDAAGEVTVKFYPLSNTTAEKAIASVRELFSPEPRGAQSRRIRAMDVSLAGAEGPVTGRIDPSRVRMSSNPGGTSMIVAAPRAAMPLIDRLVEAIDQSPVKDRLGIRRYTLTHARSIELSQTLQELFDAQRQGRDADDLPQARFIADDRTNSMLVTASDDQHAEITRLLVTADATAEEPGMEMAMITLQQASPSTVQRIVEEVIVGKDPAKRERVRISAEDGSSLFVVRAPKELLAEVRAIVAQVDAAETNGLPVRTIKLERADAQSVAQAVQRFFGERAQISSRPGQRVVNRVAVIGDRRSGTLVIASSDDDFEQVKSLAATFDAQAPTQGFQFKVIPLKNARVSEIEATIRNVVDEVRWTEAFGGGNGEQKNLAYVEVNERSNSVVVMGEGDLIPVVERVIAALDQPAEARATMIVRSVPMKNADMQAVRDAIQRAMAGPNRRSWRQADPDAVTVEIDKLRRALILVGRSERVEEAMRYITELDGGTAGAGQKIESINLIHARADRAATTLRSFFNDRARAQGLEQSGISIIGSADGNVLVASGDEASLSTLKDLVAQIDQPDLGKDRRIEVYVLRNSTPADTANVLRSMYQRQGRGEDAVIVTPQPSTNSLIVAAPNAVFEELGTLLQQLDAPPTADELNIVPVALASARATEVATALKSALPANIKITVTPVNRSNSLLLTGSKEAIAIVMDQIRAIDKEPVRSGLVFRKFKLAHIEASDLSFTLEGLLRARPRASGDPSPSIEYTENDNSLMVNAPTDMIEEIEKMVTQLDVPATEERATEFVKLQFANAAQTANALKVFYGRFAPEASSPGARNVTILPDPLSNSLVIRADKQQWEGIRALLTKLDTEEYDTTRQLEVIPLEHADAQSVAKALNDGLRAPLEEQFRQAQARASGAQRIGNRDNQRPPEATVLVDAEGVPSVSAELQTNSLIVFAGRRELDRIKEIVRQLDVTGFADMPAARIISLRNGKPSAIANTIREIYLNRAERPNGPRSVLIIGDDTASALIVRADDEKFAQISALAETLQQQGDIGRITPHIIRLRNIAAGRIRQTLLTTFTATAQSQGETLAIEIDRQSNSLVIACSTRLLEDIRKVIAELDAPPATADGSTPSPLLGQNVAIVEVKNNDPADIKKVLEELGVTKPQQADRPGIVSEPVTISILASKRALAIVASPGDSNAIEALVKAVDSEPLDAQQSITVIPLRKADATALAKTLTDMLRPASAAEQASQAAPARALTEHVRRLLLTKNTADSPINPVDLSKPVRVLADSASNALIVASTPGNIDALREVIRTLDTLPVGENLLIRIMPLQNASASRTKAVVDQLFSQSAELRRIPGTDRSGQPPTATGQALAAPISIAVDERTNTLICAGTEEALALVEVLLKDLDSDRASNWVEPAIVQLKHADASDMAAKLQEVLVRGLGTTPDAIGLQRQYGRLRMLENGEQPPADPSQPVKTIEADLFAPVTGMVISADDALNALVVVATPANLAVVKRLVAMLDVPAAAASNQVRIFPLKYAAAERVGSMARDIFAQRVATGQIREEDALIITPDVRTNSLVVATSAKSFSTLESLLKTLDGEQTNFSVGLHVIAVASADVRQLAPRIERLMRERIQAASQQGSVRSPLDAFTIEPDPTSNLLIVGCSNENLAVVNELIKALTDDATRVAAGERVEVIQLSRARAAEAVTSITELYVEKEIARRGPNAVSVTPNERLNAIVVSGNEQDMIEVRALANRIDKAEVTATQQIKWIELKSANAVEVVNLLENVLAGRPVGGGRGLGSRQATKLQFIREKITGELENRIGKPPTEAEVDGAIRDQVTLTPDPRTNSIWMTAPDAMVTIITEMVEDIEKSSAGSRKIEYFALKNADARQMAELLRDTFNLRQQGNSLVLVPNRQPDEDPANPDQPIPEGNISSSTVTAVPDERQQLAIAVDARTNTLVVSGTEEYLNLVRDLVIKLDAIQANERDRVVYHLKNAKAKEIETTLQTYFRGDADRQRSTLGPQLSGSLLRRLEEEVTVVGDEQSNKLVISTSPRYMETVLGIVKELDAAPPQVMIQVLLAEVTIDTDSQWGMDIKAGPFGGDRYTFGAAAGTAGVVTSLGVPNLAVSAADFSLLIRALQAQGKLEVLSNPQVTVNNNQKAEIQVGDEVAIVDGVERNFQGSSFADVVRQQIGIILNVTPSISSDGFVRMEIKPEISQLSAKVQNISADITAPIINKRAVDTVVTVKDGQSIVIGGLIQTIEEQRRTKVPGLGDIPLIGGAFRSKQTQARKTELLVILTPRVIPGQVDDADGDSGDTVNEATIERLEDPSAVEDYLRQIKEDIRRRQRQREPATEMPTPSSPGEPPSPPEVIRVGPEITPR